MNAERLHAIVKVLKKEMDQTRTVSNLQNLVNSLRAVVQQPAQHTQQNLAAHLEAMYSSLDNSPSDRFSPAWKQVLKELGGEGFFGQALRQSIERTIQKNQLTPTVAADELDKLRAEIEKFHSALTQAVSALGTFRVGDERLAAGECEIGILIPRHAVGNRLIEFSTELKELNFILNTFSEVATSQTEDFQIKTISSSDLLVYLHTHPLTAACLATAMERLVALYKSLLEIRKLQVDLRKQGVPDSAAKGIEEHANKHMESGIEKLSVEVVQEFYSNKDDGRRNELTTAVRFSLNNIANRIDRGYNVEVRCEPLASANESNTSNDLKKAVAIVQKASENMQFLKLDGDPILRLPEKKEERHAKDTTPKPTPKPKKAATAKPKTEAAAE